MIAGSPAWQDTVCPPVAMMRLTRVFSSFGTRPTQEPTSCMPRMTGLEERLESKPVFQESVPAKTITSPGSGSEK